MAKLVRGHPQRGAVGTPQPSGLHGVRKANAKTRGWRSLPVFDEEKVGEPAVSGMRDRSLRTAECRPLVEDGNGAVFEGDGSFSS